MTTQDIFETISSQYFQLTASEKKVADFVLSHRMDAQYMSISELAEACEVADATISRFCRRLGLGGYNAFKLELAKAWMAARTGSASEREMASVQEETPSAWDRVYRQRLQEHVSVLEQTLKIINGEHLHQAAALLHGARRVLCMGQGSSMVLALEAWTLFSTVSPKYTFVADSHFQLNSVALMGKEDVVLCFSYSGSTRELQDVLAISRPMGVKVILVSRFPKSPGGQMADLVLQCGANEGPLQVGSVSARMAQLFVLDLLFAEVCGLDPEGATTSQARVAEAASRKHL